MFLIGCSKADNISPSDPANSRVALSDQLRADQLRADQIRGLQPSEPLDLGHWGYGRKRMRLVDAHVWAKTSILIGYDGQMEAMKTAGATVIAENLIKTKPLFMQAVDENMADFIKAMEPIYTSIFSDEELVFSVMKSWYFQ